MNRLQAPAWVIHLLVVVGAVFGVVSAVELWTDRQLLDTDEWVELTDDLLADDDIRAEVAEYLVDELYEAVDIGEELAERLPDSIDGLAGIVAASLRDPVTNGVDRVLGADRTREAWRTANRVAHETIVAVLRGESGDALSSADGAITLDLGELVRQAGDDLGLSGAVLDRLPEDAGKITLVESDELGQAQDAVQALDALGFIAYVLVLVCFVAAVVLAGTRRRETVQEVGIAVVLASGVILVAARLVVRAATEAADSDADDAVSAATAISTELLRGLAFVGLAYGLLLIAAAVLAGPSRGASWVRARVAPVVVTRPSVGVISAFALLLLVLYVLPSTPFGSWWRAAVFLAAFVAVMVSLWRQMVAEFAAGSVDADTITTDTA